jgi:two-component system, LytTR family, response regulator
MQTHLKQNLLHCIIVDDEDAAIRVLENHVEDTPFLVNRGSFKNPVEALAWLQNETVDFVLLDISMPRINGIEFARTVKGKCQVVLCSAHPHYGPESYEQGVTDYLLKPVEYVRFIEAMQKVQATIRLAQKGELPVAADHMFIKTGEKGRLVKINFDEVDYIEANGNYLVMHYRNEKLLTLGTMKDILTKLPPGAFVRIHNSYIIPIKGIQKIEDAGVILRSRTAYLPVGRSYKETLLKSLNVVG